MAEEAAVETKLGETTTDQVKSMEVETTTTTTQEEDCNGKREREEEDQNNGVVEEASKKPKLDEVKPGPVSLGPKTFGSSVEMFDYFFKFLHYWPANVNVNQFEHMVLLDLLTKGHEDHVNKIGAGVEAFQVRIHPMWKSKCFFLVREDESADDFSFRKCVDHILPLPEEMKGKFDVNKAGRGGGRFGGGRGRGRGHN
jgi:hypothetical protein